MLKYYQDYYWKEGIPRGLQPLPEPQNDGSSSFKIVADPYYKRISIEHYQGPHFAGILYDSALFDFRTLKSANTQAWDKNKADTPHERYLIRNQDDRIILIETYTFESDICRSCTTQSPHGILVSTQKILYRRLGDAADGVELYDSQGKLVMRKLYAVDATTGEFTQLLEENWHPCQ